MVCNESLQLYEDTNVCNCFLLTVMKKTTLFPKPLIPVQFGAGVPPNPLRHKMRTKSRA